MSGLKSFLFFNNLSQQEVADYLGISKSYMSKLVSGVMKLRPVQLEKLLQNGNGWNTEFLTGSEWSHLENDSAGERKDEVSALRKEVEMLRDALAKAEALNKEYWQMIKNLTAK